MLTSSCMPDPNSRVPYAAPSHSQVGSKDYGIYALTEQMRVGDKGYSFKSYTASKGDFVLVFDVIKIVPSKKVQ